MTTMTALNVALPTMAGELGATTGRQLGAQALSTGLLGDRFGRRGAGHGRARGTGPDLATSKTDPRQ